MFKAEHKELLNWPRDRLDNKHLRLMGFYQELEIQIRYKH